MRKKLLLLLSVLSASSVMAEDVLQVQPIATTSGQTTVNQANVLSVQMVNSQTIKALQFDIYLPDGMTIRTTSAKLSTARMPYEYDEIDEKNVFKHSVDITDKGNGHYFLTCNAKDLSYSISGNSGEIFKLYFMTAADMQPGVYPIRIENVLLGIDGSTGIYPETSVSYVKIGTPAANTVYNLGGTTAEQLLVPSFVQTALNAETNVVVNETCRNLVLADGTDYVAASGFTAANASYSAEVTSALGYKTVVLPYASAVPAGFEAYEVLSITGNELNLTSVSTIAADKPVLLKNAGTANLSATDVAVSASTSGLTDGELIGTYAEIDAPIGSYVLQNQSGNVAFYNVQSTQPKVPAFRAYIKSQDSGARFMNIVTDGQATGIMNVESGEMIDVKSIHTVDGVRRSALTNGINIVRTDNGVKKVIINN